jgi:hypothetical protein
LFAGVWNYGQTGEGERMCCLTWRNPTKTTLPSREEREREREREGGSDRAMRLQMGNAAVI